MSLNQEIATTDTQMGNHCKRQRRAIGRSGRMRKRKPHPSLTSEIRANRLVKTRTFSADTHSIRSMTRRAGTQVFKNVYPARSQARWLAERTRSTYAQQRVEDEAGGRQHLPIGSWQIVRPDAHCP